MKIKRTMWTLRRSRCPASRRRTRHGTTMKLRRGHDRGDQPGEIVFARIRTIARRQSGASVRMGMIATDDLAIGTAQRAQQAKLPPLDPVRYRSGAPKDSGRDGWRSHVPFRVRAAPGSTRNIPAGRRRAPRPRLHPASLAAGATAAIILRAPLTSACPTSLPIPCR